MDIEIEWWVKIVNTNKIEKERFILMLLYNVKMKFLIYIIFNLPFYVTTHT